MTNTYLTGNPIGSTAVKDLYDNASNFDEALNSPAYAFFDRKLVRRETWAGMEAAFRKFLRDQGYVYLGDFDTQSPLTITLPNQLVTHAGEYWRVKPSTVLPFVTNGNWTEQSQYFVSSGDAALRSELAQQTGAGLVGATAKDGSASTIQAILDGLRSDYILVNSVAEMRLVPATFTGTVETKSYWGDGKGGGGRYSSGVAGATDDGCMTIVGADGAVRNLIYTNIVSVKQGGARGDYSKSTNTGTDDAGRLNAAHLNIPRGVIVFYPLGLFRAASGVTIPGGSSVQFTSRATSTDEAKCAIVGDLALDGVVTITGADTTFSAKVENMVVTRRAGSFANSFRGIVLSGIDQTVLVDCASYAHGIPVHVNGQLSPYMIRLNTWNCSGTHVKISNCVEPRFLNCRFGRNGGADQLCDSYILIDGAGGIQVDTVDFTSCQFNQSGGLVNSVMRVINYNNPNGIFGFTNCHFEGWSTYFLNIEASTTRLQRVKITGGSITNDSGAQLIGGNMQNVVEDLQINGVTIAATVTLDQVKSASICGGSLSGNLILNMGSGSGNVRVTGLGITGNVTLAGSGGKLGFACNQISGTINDTYTGNRSGIGLNA